jgi:hypothetical protein
LHAIEPVSDRCPNTYQREGDYCIAQSEKLKQATHVREIHWMDVLYGRPVDKWLTPFARMFRLDQKWNMFAPNPLKDDGWFVIPGQQVNGTELELFQGGEVDWEKPEQVSDMYVDQRWRKYMRNIYKKSYKDFRIYYGKHLCRAFNEGKTGDQRLQTFQLHFVRERTPPPTTTTSFTIPIDQLSFESNPDGALDFEACAEICIRDTRIDTNVSACSKKEGTGEKLAMEEILARFSCTGVEVAEPEPVKLWSHRCFKTQE